MKLYPSEPWTLAKSGVSIDAGPVRIRQEAAAPREVLAAIARRIVACVNACRDLPTEELEQVAAEPTAMRRIIRLGDFAHAAGCDMFNEEQLAAARDVEAAKDRARLASRAVAAEREIEGAQRLLTCFGIPEQMAPFKTPVAPLVFRLRRLNALRDQEVYLAARAAQSHANDMAVLQGEINHLRRRVASLTIALRPLAGLAAAYGELGLDGAAIVTVQVPDGESPRNVQLLPAHAQAAAELLGEDGCEVDS